MQCVHCGSLMQLMPDERFTVNSKIIGNVTLEHIEMLSCDCSNDHWLLTPIGSSAVEDQLRSLEAQKISLLPVSEFITSFEAADILGITRSQMAVLLRTRSCLFITHKVGALHLIYRESVFEYKYHGDGRVLIPTKELLLNCITKQFETKRFES